MNTEIHQPIESNILQKNIRDNILPNNFLLNKIMHITEEQFKKLDLINLVYDIFGCGYPTSKKYKDYYFKLWNTQKRLNILGYMTSGSKEPHYYIQIIPKN